MAQTQMEPIRWPAPVRRLLVKWDGKSWTVVHEVRVESMTLPAPDLLPHGDATTGFWIEAVDAKGHVRYREAIADPHNGMEMFEKGGEVTRVMHPAQLQHDITLELLIPDLENLTELHIVSKPAGRLPQHGHAAPTRSVLKLSPAKPNYD